MIDGKNGGNVMQFVIMTVFSLIIAGVDQLSKYFTVANIDLYEKVPFLPGFLGSTYTQNTGAAFSTMEGMRWVFVIIFALVTAAILYEYFKKPMPFTAFDRWCIAAVYGGALGNIIDRIRLGYVVDMINLDFMNFPVFNVADCFITCGCILLLVHLIFFNKGFWKDEKK